MIRVAVVSGDRLLCAGLARIFDSEESVELVAQVDRLPALSSLHPRPEVLLVDSRVEGGLELCATLREEPGLRIIFFMAARDDDAFAVGALEAGASGILPVSADADHLLKAVRVVHKGDVWAQRQVMADRLQELAGVSPAVGAPAAVPVQLSGREGEVFRHAASGMSNKELADHLGIREATIKAHLTRIFQKLGLHSRAQLAAAYHGTLAARAAAPSSGPPSPAGSARGRAAAHRLSDRRARPRLALARK